MTQSYIDNIRFYRKIIIHFTADEYVFLVCKELNL